MPADAAATRLAAAARGHDRNDDGVAGHDVPWTRDRARAVKNFLARQDLIFAQVTRRVRCQAKLVLDHFAHRMVQPSSMGQAVEPLRMMLGFVVRQCAKSLGHIPTPEELAEWANNQRDAKGRYHIFGRAISIDEARLILRHPSRMVTVRPGPRWPQVVTRVP
jgi:hypothetical protein